MGFRSYLVRRLLLACLMLFVVLFLNYMIFFLMPGDPVTLFINPLRGSQEGKDEQIRILKAQWGLDKPPLERFLVYARNMLTWNFGKSMVSRNEVGEEMGQRLYYTIELMGGAVILAILIGVSLGVFVAYKRGGATDSFFVTASLVTHSLPVFWMGLVFILIFTIALHWLPHANAVPPDWGLPGRWPIAFTITSSTSPQWNGNIVFTLNSIKAVELLEGYVSHLILPLMTLTLFQYGGFLLLSRATMIEALTEDYIVTAKAKGVSETSILFRHALKNASLPLITSAALSLGFILSGAMITEGVFSWPGLGRWIFDAINLNDYSVLQAAFYIIAVCVIIANIIADLLYGIIDPRIKYGG